MKPTKPKEFSRDLVKLKNITYKYSTRTTPKTVLKNISLSIPSGQSCAIIGSSGSGKSTLLNIIGLLDIPSDGHVYIAGKDMGDEDVDTLAITRNRLMGFVFQNFNLLPRLNALDNVALPLLYRGLSRDEARNRAYLKLTQVGLANRTYHLPTELSGGQRQRVAIARALVGEPTLILADEPTGNLDSETANEIIDLLLSLHREKAATLVTVTHDKGIAARMQRCIHIQDGRANEVSCA